MAKINEAYYDYLKLSVADYSEKVLDDKIKEVAERKAEYAGGNEISTKTYIIIGIASVALLTAVILYKKKIINF